MNKAAPKIARALILALFLIFAVLPLYWIIATSLKGPKGIYESPIRLFPAKITLDSYKKLFEMSDFAIYFRNSLILSLLASTGAMAIAVFSGFALSRYKLMREKSRIELLMYFSQTIPSFILMVPIFKVFSKFGFTDSLFALGVVYVATVIAFSTIMSKSFFDKIPAAIDEASRIDGCTQIQALFLVILPLTLPGMAAIFCFAFINIWNELFLAVMLLMSGDKMTVPVALNSFISKTGVSWDIMSAGLVTALLPTMVVFGIGQKYIVAGLTEGGVKE